MCMTMKMEGKCPTRKNGIDHSNVFRVHRILNGRVEELPDPFFGDIIPNIEPDWPDA